MRTLLLLLALAPFSALAGDYAPAVRTVNMTPGDRFAPNSVTIHVGDTVEWINRDNEAHTVTFDPRKAHSPRFVFLPPGVAPFDSGDIPAGGTFSHTFTVPGNYRYFCTPHQDHGMLGAITVLR
jgi:plastocyanin